MVVRVLPALSVLALLAGLPASAAAQDEPDVNCSDPSTQMAFNICAGEAYAAADERLNEVWRAAYAKAKELDEYNADDDATAASTLLGAQRAWLTYRDNQCESEGEWYRGGSIVPQIEADCLARMTEARTAELQAFIDE